MITDGFLAMARQLGTLLGANGLSPNTKVGMTWRFDHADGDLFLVTGSGFGVHIRRLRWAFDGTHFEYKDDVAVDLRDPESLPVLRRFLGVKR